MNTKTLGLLAALACAGGIPFIPSTTHAQGPGGYPPPPWVSGSGAPILSGSGGPPPPPWVSGSGAPILSGSGGPPPPPWVSGSGAPIVSGSGGPPPPPRVSGPGAPVLSGSGGLPCVSGTGSFESLTIRVAFTATSGTTTTATGILQATDLNGTDSGSLAIRTAGLSAGTYTVSAVTDTGTAAETLGAFDVKVPGTSGAGGPAHPQDIKTSTQFGGPRGIPFPAGLDPFSIASLAISDSNANVLFTADLTAVLNGALYARTPIVSGTSVTATGAAQIHAFAKAGIVAGALVVNASGLPDSTTYTYAINGTDITTVTTGSAGSLKLVATEQPVGGTLPDTVDLFTVTSVTVHDDSGNVILSASF